MTRALAQSYAFCERLARREAGNFYHAFQLLPRPERRSMCALYAFLRVADDLSDSAGPIVDRRAQLEDWGQRWIAALAGSYSHPLHAALCHTVRIHGIPQEYLEEALVGVGMDLDTKRYTTFEDLYRYCYRVASVVGLSCIHIWGFADERAKVLAEAAGIAFQLTNILRDLREDAERGRVYLPREDLERFGYREHELFRGERNESFRALMAFEAKRAYAYYETARPLGQFLRPAGRAVFLVMIRTYRGLLDRIVQSDFDVFGMRVRLSPWRKLWLAAQALPVRWEWF
jgi:phytoene synthase